MTKKTCSTCKELLDLSEFSKNKSKKDGYKSRCKTCTKRIEQEHVKNTSLLTEKSCGTCKIVKPADEFHKNAGRRGGLDERCKSCRNTDIVEKRHGLKKGELQTLKEKYNFKCAICEQTDELAVDHCHETGRVRGMLCNNCNNGIGRFKDNTDYLHNAITYLKEN